MNCQELEPELAALARGECSDAVRASAQEHLTECAPCRGKLAAVESAFLAVGAAPSVSAGFADTVMAKIALEPPRTPARESDWVRYILPAMTALALAAAGFYFYRAISENPNPTQSQQESKNTPNDYSEIPPYAMTQDCLIAACARDAEGAR